MADDKNDEESTDHVAVGIGVIGGTPIGESAHAAEESAPDVADPGAEDVTGDTDDVSAILAQVRADAADAPPDELERVLRERLGQVGIEKSDDELARLAEQITTGED